MIELSEKIPRPVLAEPSSIETVVEKRELFSMLSRKQPWERLIYRSSMREAMVMRIKSVCHWFGLTVLAFVLVCSQACAQLDTVRMLLSDHSMLKPSADSPAEESAARSNHSVAFQQLTLLRKDLDRFRCKLAVTRDSLNQVHTDISQILEWRLDSGDIQVQQRSSVRKSQHDTEWLRIALIPQHGQLLIRPPRQSAGDSIPVMEGFYFFMMEDIEGYGGYPGVLSVWRTVGRDSLQLRCLHAGYYEGGLSSSWVDTVAFFPDKSILLWIANGGEFWGSNLFLRGDTACNFELFYQTSWRGRDHKMITYDMIQPLNPYYRVIEATSFLSEDTLRPGADGYSLRLDSADVRVIDLWEIAKEHLDIDTTETR